MLMNIRLYLISAGLCLLSSIYSMQTSAQTWQALGPSGGTVNMLAQTSNGDNLYAATSHGVYLSHNQGASWQGFVRGLQGANIKKIVLDEPQQQAFAVSDKGLFASLWVDDELVWQPFNQQLPSLQVSDLAFDATTGVLYALLDEHGLFHRKRDAAAWTLVNADIATLQLQEVFVLDSGALLTSSEQALLLSTNAGISWQTLTVPTAIRQFQVINAQQWWLAADEALWKTLDAGQTWQPITLPPLEKLYSFFAHPRELHPLYLSSNTGNFSSADNGNTWQKLLLPVNNAHIQTWTIHPQNEVLYAGTLHLGVLKNDIQAEIWELARFGLQATDVTTLQVSAYSPDNMYITERSGGLLKTQNGGRTWQPYPGLPLEINHVLPTSINEILYAATSQGIFRSQPRGLRWLPELSNISIHQLTNDPLNPERLYAATTQGVYQKNLNSEHIWQLIGLAEQSVTTLLATPEGQLYAGTQTGQLYQSLDSGVNWVLHSTPNAGVVNDLHTYQDAEQSWLLAATATGGLRYDNDLGWQSLADLNFAVNQFDSAIQHPGYLYTATAKGIFRSQDAGLTWSSLNADLPLLPFNQIHIAPTQPVRIYAASQGSGIFMLALNDLQAIGLSSENLNQLSAEQLSAIPANNFSTFNADNIRALPANSLTGLSSEHVAHLTADALSGLSAEQFVQIPAEALFGLHTGNFPGLSQAVLQTFNLDTLQALDHALLQRLDGESLSRLLQVFNSPLAATSTEISRQLPANWQSAALSNDWSLLPVGSPLPIPSLPNGLDTPDLASTDLLNDMQTVLGSTLFADYQLQQNAAGIVSLNSDTISYAYLPAPRAAIQNSALAPAGWQLNLQGQVLLTTAKHQQVTLNPTTYSLEQLSALTGEQGWVWLNAQGDALLYDTLSIPAQYRMLSFFASHTHTTETPSGIYPIDNQQFKLVYPSSIQQQASPAIPQPQDLLDALYRLGAEFAIYQMDGTCLVQFSGIRYVLRPQAGLEVVALAENQEQLSRIKLYADEEGNAWLDYQTQWKHLSLTTRLQIDAGINQRSLQNAVGWEALN